MSNIIDICILDELDKLRRKEEPKQQRVYIDPPKPKGKEEVDPIAKEEDTYVYDVDFDIKTNEFDI